ncbi:MAG: hypothetical protein JNL38_10075 [Myxococcales bacterium]|nr:hypothetical protein [Myxococcales bacterium]
MPRPLIQRLAVTVTVAAATAGVVGLVAGGASAGEPRADAGPARPDGGADAAPRRIWINGPPPPPAIVITKTPPDPTPSRTRAKWVFDLKYDHGSPYLMAVRRLELAAPEDAPRMMGRFALELYEGPTLIERVRFDFPMLGVPEPDAGFGAPPRIEPKLVTRVGVFFPALDKGTRLELWDRATDRRWTRPWPPAATVASPPSASDAGPPGEVDGGAP